MPEPDNSLFSTDYILYKFIYNPLARKLPFIYPNTITLIGSLITFPMALNLLYNSNFYVFILLGMLRTSFDCLDGALARENNMQSKLGALLDVLNDTIFCVVLGSVSIYKLILNKYLISAGSILVLVIYMIGHFIQEIKGNRTYQNMFYGNIDKFLHDNTTIISLFIFYYLKSNI